MNGAREVLLVEDDDDDVLLVEEGLRHGRGLLALRRVADGMEAMDYLRRRGAHAGAARPAFVLLDWRLPGKSGLQVLREARAEPELRSLPIIVLTTSSSERDVQDAYDAGATCFLTKPTGLDAMRALLASIEEFWLVHAQLPAVKDNAGKWR